MFYFWCIARFPVSSSLPSNCSLIIILSLNTVASEICLEDMIDIGVFLFIVLEQQNYRWKVLHGSRRSSLAPPA